MSSDLTDSIADALTRALEIIGGLGIIVPLILFGVVNLLGRRKKSKPSVASKPAPPAARGQQAQPFPYGPPAWMEMDTPPLSSSGKGQWGSTYHDKSATRAEPIRWGSAFGNEREQTKWGFDDSEWGSAFGPKKDDEPTITIG